jgi:ADP-ribose pyrophosphatase
VAEPWRRAGGGDVLTTRIFTVEKQGLVHPRSGHEHDFYILRAPDWCNIVPLTHDNQVVMVRQRRHGIGAETLELPGGMIDPEDCEPLRGCVRELREETGYEGTSARLIGVTSPNPAMQSNRCHTALVEHARLVGAAELDDGEDIEVVLVPYREIPARIARGEITHALVVVAFTYALGLVPP